MNLKKVILSDASTEAKVSAIAILLDKELPKLAEKVDTVKKLKGDQGERGVKGDKGDKGSDGKDGKDGRNGTDGSSGKNGKDGKDGVSVIDAKIDFDGSLVMKLSSNKEINVGEVVPSNLQEKIKLVTSGGAGTVLPNQTGNSGKVLGTDGTTLSWVAGGGGGGGTAAANAGIAIDSNVYSTTYNTLISDSLTVPTSVGGITAGTTASSLKSKNIVEIIDDLLFPTVLPTYTIPAIATFTASQSGFQEIGSTISQVLNQTHNKNDAGAYTSLVFKRGVTTINTVSSPTGTSITNIEAQFGYADPNNPNLSYSSSFTNSGYVVPVGSTTWTAEGTYDAGIAKQNNKGGTDSRSAAVRSVNAPQAASTLVSSSLGITGIYPYFWGVSSTQPTAAGIATAIQAGTANKVLFDAGSSIAITFSASSQYIWFVTAATYANKTTWYNTALNNGSIGAGQFILDPVTQNVTSPQGYWSAVSFKVYISGYATTTSGSIIFS